MRFFLRREWSGRLTNTKRHKTKSSGKAVPLKVLCCIVFYITKWLKISGVKEVHPQNIFYINLFHYITIISLYYHTYVEDVNTTINFKCVRKVTGLDLRTRMAGFVSQQSRVYLQSAYCTSYYYNTFASNQLGVFHPRTPKRSLIAGKRERLNGRKKEKVVWRKEWNGRELKQQRRLRKRHSKRALLQTSWRLLHLVQFIKCWQIYLEMNSKRLYRS